jgi:hypothetical protein
LRNSLLIGIFALAYDIGSSNYCVTLLSNIKLQISFNNNIFIFERNSMCNFPRLTWLLPTAAYDIFKVSRKGWYENNVWKIISVSFSIVFQVNLKIFYFMICSERLTLYFHFNNAPLKQFSFLTYKPPLAQIPLPCCSH